MEDASRIVRVELGEETRLLVDPDERRNSDLAPVDVDIEVLVDVKG